MENHPAIWSSPEIWFNSGFLAEDNQLGTPAQQTWPVETLTMIVSPRHKESLENNFFRTKVV